MFLLPLVLHDAVVALQTPSNGAIVNVKLKDQCVSYSYLITGIRNSTFVRANFGRVRVEGLHTICSVELLSTKCTCLEHNLYTLGRFWLLTWVVFDCWYLKLFCVTGSYYLLSLILTFWNRRSSFLFFFAFFLYLRIYNGYTFHR